MKTILIADDDPHTRQLVRETLAAPEYRILEVESGKQALAHFSAEATDLVILDWMMPGLSGLEVARELQRRAERPRILMLTARSQRVDAVLAHDAGVQHFLTKPFSPLDLIATVESMVAQ